MTVRVARGTREQLTQAVAAWPALVLGLGGGFVLVTVALSLPGWLGPALLAAVPVACCAGLLGLWDQQWGLCVFAVALPSGLLSLVDGVQVIQVFAVLAILLVVSGRVLSGRVPLRFPRTVVPLLFLVAWSTLTTPMAVDVPAAIRWNVALLTGVLLVSAVVSTVETSLARLQHLALMLLSGSVFTCAFALPESAKSGSFGAAVVEGRAQGVFSQPNELGLFAGTTMMLALGLWVGGPVTRYRRLERLWVGIGAIVAVFALLLSLSRGAWLGSLLATTVAIALSAAVRRVSLVVLGSCLMVGVLLTFTGSLPSQLDVISARAGLIADRKANPYDERPAIWEEGLRQVHDHPWTGVGAAGFPDASARSSSTVAAAVRPEHAHNVLLNFTAEGGVPAGLALIVAVGLAGQGVLRGRARRGWSQSERAFLTAIGCVPLVILGQGLLDAPIRNPTTLLQTAAAIGLAIAVPCVYPRAGPQLSAPRRQSLMSRSACR